MNTKFVIAILLSIVCNVMQAQQTEVLLITDPKLNELIAYYKQLNAGMATQDGYRIQLFNGNNRTTAEEMKIDFLKKFPDIPVYLIYQQPNFKLRVGDFTNRFEALKLYRQLQNHYQPIILVPDKINIPK